MAAAAVMEVEGAALLEEESTADAPVPAAGRKGVRPVAAVLLLALVGFCAVFVRFGGVLAPQEVLGLAFLQLAESQSGVEACEGYDDLDDNENACRAKGCCQYDDDACWSEVGTEPCGAGEERGAAPPGRNGEEACQYHNFNREACMAVGCCHFNGGQCWSAIGSEICETPPPPPPPEDDDDKSEGCDKLPKVIVDQLDSAKLTQRRCPHNILVAALDNVPKEWVQTAAAVLDELVDRDGDGECDDPQVCAALSFASWDENGRKFTLPWAGGGGSGDAERGIERAINDGYCFSLQAWKGPEGYREIVTEEIFHMVHQMGWARVYRDHFGMDGSWGSLLGKEVKKHQCVQPGWHHPENTCPPPAPREKGNPSATPTQGTCSGESCDVAEFFHQAMLTFIGQRPGWFSEYMPRRKNELEKLLSKRFQQALKHPKYALPREPLQYNRGELASSEEGTRKLDTGIQVDEDWDMKTLDELFHGEVMKAATEEEGDAHGLGTRRRSTSAAWSRAKQEMRKRTPL